MHVRCWIVLKRGNVVESVFSFHRALKMRVKTHWRDAEKTQSGWNVFVMISQDGLFSCHSDSPDNAIYLGRIETPQVHSCNNRPSISSLVSPCRPAELGCIELLAHCSCLVLSRLIQWLTKSTSVAFCCLSFLARKLIASVMLFYRLRVYVNMHVHMFLIVQRGGKHFRQLKGGEVENEFQFKVMRTQV